MKCISCGAELPDNARFCGTCGTKLEAAPVNTPETPAPEPAPVVTPPVAPAPPAAPVTPVAPAAPVAPVAAPAAPVAPPAAPAAPVATAAPVYAQNAAPVYNYPPQPQPIPPQPQAPIQPPVDDRRTRVMSTGGYMAALFLMSIPIVGFILQIVWAAGAARNLNRRHLARGYLFLSLIVFAVTVILGLLGASAYSAFISNILRNVF